MTEAGTASSLSRTGASIDRTRAVLSIAKAPAGVSELHLECGHVLRRRLSFCPPKYVRCPFCEKGETAAQAIAPAQKVF